jgi:hypothetical protein
MVLSLLNGSADFTPGNTSSPYSPNITPLRKIRCRATYGGQDIAPATAVTDNFNRVNSGSLGANWTDLVSGLGITSNTCKAQSAGQKGAYWSGTQISQFGPNVECGVKIATMGATNDVLEMFVKTNAAGDGYGFQYTVKAGNDEVKLVRLDSSTPVQLGDLDTSQAWAAGDSIAIRYVEETGELELWRKPSAGAWAQVTTRTDTTYRGGYGFTSLWLTNTTFAVDDFFTGNFATFELFTGWTESFAADFTPLGDDVVVVTAKDNLWKLHMHLTSLSVTQTVLQILNTLCGSRLGSERLMPVAPSRSRPLIRQRYRSAKTPSGRSTAGCSARVQVWSRSRIRPITRLRQGRSASGLETSNTRLSRLGQKNLSSRLADRHGIQPAD